MYTGLTGRLALLALLPLAALAADALLPKADRDPTPPTDEQKILVKDGIALHDQGDYDGAIAKYRQVLDANPGEISALYELAFTYYTRRDYPNALDTGRRAAQYRSPALPRIHGLIASVLDDTGKRGEAIAVFREAIRQSPKTALLHFNLALTLIHSGQLPEARSELEKSVTLDPNHASSHYQLGVLYSESGYRIPAVLALSRFLLLEPAGERAQKALGIVEPVLRGNLTPGEKPGDVKITILQAPERQKDEGDFDTVETSIGIGAAAAGLDSNKGQTPFQARATIYVLIGEVLSRVKPAGFAARYYAPFFAELQKRKFSEAFVSSAFAGPQLAGAGPWADQNPDQPGQFQEWLKSYRWPEK